MKAIFLAAALVLASGMGQADELGDASKLWADGQYQQALSIFSRLANGGNAGAQLQIGEMFGYGEGVTEDIVKAEYWLNRAIQNGNAAAAESLSILQQRAAHKADIAYYTTNFDGGAVRLSNFDCKAPAIPAISKDSGSVRDVDRDIAQWRLCQNAFAQAMNAVLPAGKAIPDNIARLMSLNELKQAHALMDKTYTRIEAVVVEQRDQVLAQREAWAGETVHRFATAGRAFSSPAFDSYVHYGDAYAHQLVAGYAGTGTGMGFISK